MRRGASLPVLFALAIAASACSTAGDAGTSTAAVEETCGNRIDPGFGSVESAIDCASDTSPVCTTTGVTERDFAAELRAESANSANSACLAPLHAATCGNGVCEPGEDPTQCNADCGEHAGCGDGVCQSGENAISCAADCDVIAAMSWCGDGTCAASAGENAATCPADCGAATTLRTAAQVTLRDEPAVPGGERGTILRETAVERTSGFRLEGSFLGVSGNARVEMSVANKTQVIFELASGGAGQGVYQDAGSLTVYSNTLFRAWRTMVFADKTTVGGQMKIGVVASATAGVDDSTSTTTISEITYGALTGGFARQFPAWEVMGYARAEDAANMRFDARRVMERMIAYLSTDEKTAALRSLHEANMALAHFGFHEKDPDFGCRYVPKSDGSLAWACDFAKCPTFYLDLVDRGAGQFGPDVFPVSLNYNYFQAKVRRLDVFGNAGLRNASIQISHDGCEPELDEIDMSTVSVDTLRPRYFGALGKETGRAPARILRRRPARVGAPVIVNEDARTDEVIRAYPNYGSQRSEIDRRGDPW